jgi:hypothetical protein
MQTSKPRSAPPKSSSSNEYLGFLSGKKNTPRNQRRQQFRKANPTPPLNTGASGTMITSPEKPTVKVNPSSISQSISLPPDIQEKINRWRENRLKHETPTTNSTQDSSLSFAGTQQQMIRTPLVQNQQQTARPVNNMVNSNNPIQMAQMRGRLVKSSPVASPPPPTMLVTDVSNFISEEDEEPQPDETEEFTQNETHPPVKNISLFDPQQQEIMKGQVEFEVKRILDQLKKERPELTNQADIVNAVNQKTRVFEESLQQFNVREQRLRDMVDQMNVTIKAVQSNVDNTKSENGGQFITENVMKSWVSFFLSEQMANIKTELRSDIVRLNEKTTQQTSDINTLETTSRLLETKLQNTLQTIFESVLFVRASVLGPVSSYETTSTESKSVRSYVQGEELILVYPVVKMGEDRWMKVKSVDSVSAQLSESWVPVLLNQVPLVGDFKL